MSLSHETRYVCVACKREGTMDYFQDNVLEECKPGWTHDRLLEIVTTAENALRADFFERQMFKLAEIGAALCTYAPGAGSVELWPESRCDCKFMHPAHVLLPREGRVITEETGCAEVRAAYRVLKARAEGPR